MPHPPLWGFVVVLPYLSDLERMEIVSKIMVSISLNKNIDCNKLCQEVIKLIHKHSINNQTHNLILTIDVKTVTDDNNFIPKIEYKNS
jgi:hypothetical protein